MNRDFPVYTIENECQDCYKCVRHCPCKAIKIVNARAAVIPDRCVCCGECVRVCPAHAKKIRSDAARLNQILSKGGTIYASVAPSFPGYFKNITLGQLASALKKLGFTGISETAHGAQLVSSAVHDYLKTVPNGVYLSSACPACVRYVEKYLPNWSSHIVPFDSPVISHCKLLRKTYGNSIQTVFFGPCAAKKNEADEKQDILNLAVTFVSLEKMLEEKGISLKDEPESPAELALGPAEEGRVYSFEGGMNDTVRSGDCNTRFIAVSGLEHLQKLLSGIDPASIKDNKIFIEMLACRGGCVNGPVMDDTSASVQVVANTDLLTKRVSSVGREVPVDIHNAYFKNPVQSSQPSEEEILKALASVGKFSKADELNCGACGYNSCRDFACALIVGKAETSMCHNYLRSNFQRTSNALIKYIPAGVVIVDDSLRILESNRHFAELIDENTLAIHDSLGSLASIQLDQLIPFTDLFESVLANGGEIEKFNQPMGDRIVNISVFSIAVGKTAGAVIQDVTRSELQREQIAEKAQEIIRKNVLTVQEVARLFGEHVAETEILLDEIAGSYSGKREKEKEKEKEN